MSFPDLVRRTTTYVDTILKGPSPSIFPSELVINMKTAKALGLTIPPAALARTDEVVQ